MSPAEPVPSRLIDVRLRVPAMDCADEVALVRGAVETDPGVVAVSFDLVHARVDLTIDPAQTSEARLREAIAHTGLAVESMATYAPATPARHVPALDVLAQQLRDSRLVLLGTLASLRGGGPLGAAVFDRPVHVHRALLCRPLPFRRSDSALDSAARALASAATPAPKRAERPLRRAGRAVLF